MPNNVVKLFIFYNLGNRDNLRLEIFPRIRDVVSMFFDISPVDECNVLCNET